MTPRLVDRLIWLDGSDRTRLRISGPDRAKFLHNLTTNDVKRLAAGSGQEAFVTSPQGKTLAYVTLLATEDAIWLGTDPGVAALVLPHLSRYGVFDEVLIEDVSSSTCEISLTGPGANELLVAAGVGPNELSRPLMHREVDLAGRPVRVVRDDRFNGVGWTLIAASADRVALVAFLTDHGATAGSTTEREILRIEAGWPASGRDVQAGNLPQEVGRDDRTINFVKGCYLGQETVARLDALGHVNRILRGGWIEGSSEIPPDGTALVGIDGKPAGTITSATFSPGRNRPIWLGYVRVTHADPGIRLRIPALATRELSESEVVAVVTSLPLPQ